MYQRSSTLTPRGSLIDRQEQSVCVLETSAQCLTTTMAPADGADDVFETISMSRGKAAVGAADERDVEASLLPGCHDTYSAGTQHWRVKAHVSQH